MGQVPKGESSLKMEATDLQIAEAGQYLRQIDIFDPTKIKMPVSIIGAGGIGSVVTLALAKMGLTELDVYDFDQVADWNVPNQMFRPDQIGSDKVDALLEVVDDLTGVTILPIKRKIGEQEQENPGGIRRGGIVVSAVDSMEARSAIWKEVRMNPKFRLLVDGRLGGESIVLYSVNPCDPSGVEAYEATLHPDDEGEELSCTARSIIWTTFFIGAFVSRAIGKFLKDGTITSEVALDSAFLTMYQSEDACRPGDRP